MKRSLGPQESLFFALMQMRGQRTVRTGELIGPMEITSQQEEELLRRLARGRLIARVRRGLYLIPSRLPVGGSWSPDEVLAPNTLIEDRGGRYQICGPNAFNRYGFDDQIPTRAYDWIRRELAAKRVKPRELVTLALQYGDIGTIRRIAALLEIERVEASLL